MGGSAEVSSGGRVLLRVMAFDEKLAARVRDLLAAHKPREQAMFGGLAFMVKGKMAVGVMADGLMLRVDPEREGVLVKKAGAEPFVHAGRPMGGWLRVGPAGVRTAAQLAGWVEEAMAYNPKAKASKARKPAKPR